MRKLLIIFLILIYIMAGKIYGNWQTYASYHPKSWAAAILVPVAPFVKNGPFHTDTPAENPDLKKKYGNYEKYASSSEAVENKIWCVLMWPIIMLLGYVVALITWLIYSGIHLYYLLAAIVAVLSP